MKKRSVALCVAALLFCGVIYGRKKAPNPEELGAELRKAPAKANSWQNPYAGQPEAIQAGKKLFLKHCAECHGQNGRGREKAPDLLLPPIERASPGVLYWFLKNGNLPEGMPSWSRLPDQQLWQMVAYLKTLR